MLKKYVDEGTFYMSEEEVRKEYPDGYVYIYYAFNDYREDVQHILELRDCVLKDYPNMRERDMTVRVIERHMSIRHFGVTTLAVQIPVDDYLKLKERREIEIR